MKQREFFEKVISFLNQNSISYMVTGSIGAMLFGKPRFTNGMDVVVNLSSKDIPELIRHFSGGSFYLPEADVVEDEINNQGQFNLIHIDSGSKIDFIIRKNNEFAIQEFARKKLLPFTEDVEADTASPEDIIISKMQYYHMGGSEKHMEDIRNILSIMKEKLDVEYISMWARKLSLQDIWFKCLEG